MIRTYTDGLSFMLAQSWIIAMKSMELYCHNMFLSKEPTNFCEVAPSISPWANLMKHILAHSDTVLSTLMMRLMFGDGPVANINNFPLETGALLIKTIFLSLHCKAVQSRNSHSWTLQAQTYAKVLTVLCLLIFFHWICQHATLTPACTRVVNVFRWYRKQDQF